MEPRVQIRLETHLGRRAQLVVVVVDLLVVCGALSLVSGVVMCTLAVPAALGDLNFLRLDRMLADLGPGLVLCGVGTACFAGVLLAGGWRARERRFVGHEEPRMQHPRADSLSFPLSPPSSLSPLSPLAAVRPLAPMAPEALSAPGLPVAWPSPWSYPPAWTTVVVPAGAGSEGGAGGRENDASSASDDGSSASDGIGQVGRSGSGDRVAGNGAHSDEVPPGPPGERARPVLRRAVQPAQRQPSWRVPGGRGRWWVVLPLRASASGGIGRYRAGAGAGSHRPHGATVPRSG
jgi:hypothetical protein